MRYMMMVKADKDYEAGRPPSPELMAAIGKLSEEMARSGRLVDQGGLLPSSQGARVQVSGGKIKVLDGPFSEAKELVGGYAIFDLETREEAIELASQFMKLHADVLGPSYVGEVEVRPMFGPEDFA
jgi:hypothetical protein